MRNILKLLIIAVFILVCFQDSDAQNIQERSYEPLNKETVNLTKTPKEINKTEGQRSVELCIETLDKLEDINIRHKLIYWEFPFRYASLKQYNSC